MARLRILMRCSFPNRRPPRVSPWGGSSRLAPHSLTSCPRTGRAFPAFRDHPGTTRARGGGVPAERGTPGVSLGRAGPEGARSPSAVREDSERAVTTHPDPVLLPTGFGLAWGPTAPGRRTSTRTAP
ncbi:DUF5954 family protein [Streptomyces sp. NPDC050546]|uniref:DUF5954 family protein n=1 Tax=Streptomyces sp. NPDC050546 TaxID=3365628 RepID=UPI00378A4831